jgi:zinc transport system permease protein
VIFPVLTAMRVGKRYLSVTILSAIVAIIGFFLGMVISFVYETPSGASVVCVNIVLFGLFAIFGGIRNAVKKN